MQTLLDPLFPRGMWNYFRSAFFDDLDDAADALIPKFAAVPNPISELHIHHLGGAMGRVPEDATAFATRNREYLLNIVARSADADGYPAAVAWAREATDSLSTDASAYVNFTGEASEDRVRASYPKATYDRLVSVKESYDPTNLFQLNQNIKTS
jgi:hypothetical protein